MAIYTVLVTVRLVADSESDAYRYIRHTLTQGKNDRPPLEHVDSEVIETQDDDDGKEMA